jgi:hypothetical protein
MRSGIRFTDGMSETGARRDMSVDARSAMCEEERGKERLSSIGR